MNSLKTVFFMSLMTALFVVIGNLLGGNFGMIIGLGFAVVMNFGSYWFSDKIVLSMYGARQVDAASAPKLYLMVERLARNANLPMPKVYVMNNDTPNAFATGRNPKNAAVAVTTGILRLINDQELEAVIGHELAHVKNRDILIGSVAATFAGAITMIANMAQWAMIFGRSDDEDSGGLIGGLVMMIVAPIAATMLQMAISRSREYIADRDGAQIAGNPMALASALAKLHNMNHDHPIQGAGPATAHMFIINPLSGGGVFKLFSTHPPVEERIKRLREQAAGRA
ncbi:MAG: zinc metalloprotease HtpX [Ignavibacteriaceae bacterium]|nr:zinc metalloprotease HtpX [Ignavibacteriaceae bacterium]